MCCVVFSSVVYVYFCLQSASILCQACKAQLCCSALLFAVLHLAVAATFYPLIYTALLCNTAVVWALSSPILLPLLFYNTADLCCCALLLCSFVLPWPLLPMLLSMHHYALLLLPCLGSSNVNAEQSRAPMSMPRRSRAYHALSIHTLLSVYDSSYASSDDVCGEGHFHIECNCRHFSTVCLS